MIFKIFKIIEHINNCLNKSKVGNKKRHRNFLIIFDAFNLNPGSTYCSGPSPAKYRQRSGLYYRIRNGNGCFPTTIATREIS